MLCWHHGSQGGATKDASRAKREANETFARLLEHEPRRHPWEVIADAVHLSDAAMRDQWQRVVDLDELPADELARLLELGRHAHAMAASAITTRAAEIRVQVEQRQADIVSRAISRVRDDPALGLTMEEKSAFDAAVAREIQAVAEVEEVVDQKAITTGRTSGRRGVR